MLFFPSSLMFLPSQLFQVAMVAHSVMAADCPATVRTTPFGGFFFQKFIDAVQFYKFKVLDHAHMVKGTVAFIQMFQSTAGVLFAFKAKPHQAFPQQVTALFHEGAIFTTRQAAGTVLLAEALLLQVVLHCQEAAA